MKIILMAAVIAALIPVFDCAGQTVKGDRMTVLPDAPEISYSGRVDFTDPKAPRFDWPGINIGINFEGSAGCAANIMDEGRNDFNIIIDGSQAGVLRAKEGVEHYALAQGLGAGPHTLLLTKRTESYDGITVFKGFELEAGAKLLPATAKKKRKIEFIGDSLSVGFGVEGPGIQCDSERKYKNNYMAFSAVAARALDADYHIVAISGRGVVKNYGEKKAVSQDPMPFYYDRVISSDAGLKWDFKSWAPDAVVINLGTNDFSTEPKPEKGLFTGAYKKIIEAVRKRHPDAHIFICAGPTQSEPFFRYLKEMLDGIKDEKLHRVDMTMLKEGDYACDWHPNVKAAERMAGELAKKMKRDMPGFWPQ